MKLSTFSKAFLTICITALTTSIVLTILQNCTNSDFEKFRCKENDIHIISEHIPIKSIFWEQASPSSEYLDDGASYELFNRNYCFDGKSFIKTSYGPLNSFGIELISVKPVLYRLQVKGWVEDKTTICLMIVDTQSEETFVGYEGSCFPEKSFKINSIELILENCNGIVCRIPHVIIFDEQLNECVTLRTNSHTYTDGIFSFCDSKNKKICFSLSASEKVFKTLEYQITLLGFDFYNETVTVEKQESNNRKIIQTLKLIKRSDKEICLAANS